MKYNFDEVVNRKNTACSKWDSLKEKFGRDDILPMWVADMDFKTAEPILKAVREKLNQGFTGYGIFPDSYHEAIRNWVLKRHGWRIKTEWISHTIGVVPALAAAIKAFTQPGDKVVIQTPVYHPFYVVIEENGRRVVKNKLRETESGYKMDFDDLEKQIDSRTKMMILCSPHNPVGRVWTRSELQKLGEICLKHNLTIVSDEIHSDLVYEGHKHTPLASLSDELAENTITCISASKTFNLAGLTTSQIIIPNSRLRNDFNNFWKGMHIERGNILGLVANEAAYRYGSEWLNELLAYLQGNIDFMTNYISEKIPKVKVFRPEGTYLAWLDFREFGMNDKELSNFLTNEAKVALNNGAQFGEEGEGFVRLNFGCPRSILEEGLKRIERAVNNL